MRDQVAIVEVDIAQLERELHAEHVELQDGERKADSISAANEAKRVSLGKKLIKARQALPIRGNSDDGWRALLKRTGIAEASARRWMEKAGYVSLTRQVTHNEPASDEDDPRRDEQPDGPPVQTRRTQTIRIDTTIGESEFDTLRDALQILMQNDAQDAVSLLQKLVPALREP